MEANIKKMKQVQLVKIGKGILPLDYPVSIEVRTYGARFSSKGRHSYTVKGEDGTTHFKTHTHEE